MKKTKKLIQIEGSSNWETTVETLYKAIKKMETESHKEEFLDPMIKDLADDMQLWFKVQYEAMLEEIEEVLKNGKV